MKCNSSSQQLKNIYDNSFENLKSKKNLEVVDARCEICKKDGQLFFLPKVGIFILED